MSPENLIEKLQAYGADMDGALERCVDDAELYQSCFDLFLSDQNFVRLKQALDKDDYKQAFEAAHSLKGITGNLGLTPIYKDLCALVEPLRKHDPTDTSRNAEFQEKLQIILSQLALLKAMEQ